AVKQKLSKPVQTDDGPIDEQVGEIVWTAADRKAGIQPGEFRDFPLSVVSPGKAGQDVAFKALQTYSNGSVVRWIGAPDADEPAPQVKLTAATTGAADPGTPQRANPQRDRCGAATEGAAAPAPRQRANPQPAPAAASTDSGSSDTLSIVALIVGA